MKKTREILLISVIGLAFAGACVWVFVSKGRSSAALKLKLRTGAAIIALSSFAVQSCVTVTCYNVAPSNYIYPTDSISPENHIIINLQTNSTIDFSITSSESDSLWYKLSDTVGVEIKLGSVIVKEGNLSGGDCTFAVPLSQSIVAGNYFVRLYLNNPANIENSNEKGSLFTRNPRAAASNCIQTASQLPLCCTNNLRTASVFSSSRSTPMCSEQNRST